ncbi:MAG: PIN domain-containing protein [Chitinivibrionia bacterium]|nr:PIN domain-containing protein [Chitinivibrionia bacterium]
MKIVVDTNIVFSALLNSSSQIGKILVYSPKECFSFYTCSYLRDEILNHFEKIQKYTKLDNSHLFELIQKIERKITFIDDRLLPKDVLQKAKYITCDVDCDDMAFVSVADYLNANLWTGDKILINGLCAKGYNNFKTTSQMIKLLEDYEKNNPLWKTGEISLL